VFKRRYRSLRISARAFKSASHAPPEIDLVAQVERRVECVGGQSTKARGLLGRITLPRVAWIQVQAGHQFAAGHSGGRPRGVDTGRGRPDFLVGFERLGFQTVESCITKNLPPVSLRNMVKGLALLPITRLRGFVLGGNHTGWP